jgi:hypothetical protein
MKKHQSKTDLLVIGITTILFIVALFVKGLTKEILLEAGVLLVSVKLIMMNHKASISRKRIMEELSNIKETLKNIENTKR